ncbi:MAG: LamG-like jellyroll fold domain-containing protein [Chloroflexota bacterium]
MVKLQPFKSRLLSLATILAMLLPFARSVMAPSVAQAADSGWHSPTANAADTGGDDDGFEENPIYAYADDADFAANRSGADDRHRYYAFGFDSTIPADAVINGIQVRLDGWVDHAASSPQYEIELSWDGGSTWSSALSTPLLTGSEETYILGAQDDLWGHAWSASELADASLSVRITSRDGNWPNRHFFLDWIAVRVHYDSAHIDGTIWADENADGLRDDGETGLSGVHVTVYQDDGDQVFEGESQDVQMGADDTGPDGRYDTGPFADGYGYWVDVTTPDSRYLTTPPEPRLVNLSGGSAVTVDFGYAPEIVTHPNIEIAKTPDTQTIISGAMAAFTIAITNSGDITLTNVTVSDPLAPDCARTFTGFAPGANEVYNCTLADVTADFTNTASVSGTPPGGPDVSHSDTAAVDVIHPAIEIAKTPDEQTVGGDFTATFTIAITNSGDVPLADVTVSDPLAPGCARTFAELAVGANEVYNCTLSNVTADFTNTASVSGAPPAGDDVTASDTAQVQVDREQTCPADMLAYWRLDETSGSAFDDYFDGHEAQCAGQCPAPIAGHIDGAQDFNGSDTGLNVPDHTAFDWGLGDSFSIELWMQTDSSSACAGSNQVIIGRDDPSTSLHWWVGCQKDTGRARFYLIDTSGSYASLVGSTDLTDGNWHHVVAVREAGTGQTVRLYVDGLEQDSQPTSFTGSFGSTAAINIGWLNLSGGFYFDGAVDDTALYDRALPPSEIQQHHAEGLTGRWVCQVDNFAPSIVSSPIVYAAVGKPYSYNVQAVGNPPPTFALLAGPGGMTLDPTTGQIAWTPTVAQEGEHNVQIEASNTEGNDTQSFAVAVIQGLIAYWKLDETEGMTYDDALDGHDGGCAGDCPAPAAGHTDGGQAFDGSSSGIDVPPHSAFDWGPDDSFSIEFWLRTDSASTCAGNQVVVGRDDSASQLHWWVGCRDGGQATFYLVDSDGQAASVIGTTDLTDGGWHHVTAVRDAGVKQLRLYVDETREGAATTAFAAGFDSTTAALNIGWLNLSGGFHFDGHLDEIMLYDTAIAGAAPFPGDERIFLPIVIKQ